MPPRRARAETVSGHDEDQSASEVTGAESAVDKNDLITILVATDHHLGYAERDPVRGRDSFAAFEECLQLAVEHKVDFILFGGDLFHENKPSRQCLFETNVLIRKYCLGDKPIGIQVLSEPTEWARPGVPEINYEDENLNVAYPIFSIHGNHDDPQGSGPHGALSALDYLSSHGYINYFGRIELNSNEQSDSPGFTVKPILLQKGQTKLALYGMGNVRDDRLYYELKSNHVRLFRPTETPDEWFNILVLHQNRAVHNPKNAVPEGMLDDSFNLIIWGHEHDCRIDPEPIAGKNYFISQPGSTVATSLTEGESKPKHVTLVKIRQRDFSMTPLRLKSSRGVPLGSKHEVQKYLRSQVNKLIGIAHRQWRETNSDSVTAESTPPLPLIRLKVDYTGSFEIGNSQRFGQEFAGKIANPKDVIQFYRKKQTTNGVTGQSARSKILEDIAASDLPNKAEMLRLGDLVRETLSRHQLDMLGEDDFETAILSYVDKDDRDAIKDFIESTLTATRREIGKSRLTERHLDDAISKSRPAPKSKSARASRLAPVDEEVLESDAESHSRARASRPARSRRERADSMESGPPRAPSDDDEEDDSREIDVAERGSSTGRQNGTTARRQLPPPSTPLKRPRTTKATSGSTGRQSTISFPPTRPATRTPARRAIQDVDDEILDDDDDDGGQAGGSTARTSKRARTRR